MDVFYRTPLSVFGPGVPGVAPSPPPVRGTVTTNSHVGGTAIDGGLPTPSTCLSQIAYDRFTSGPDSFVEIQWETETSPGVWTLSTNSDFIRYISGYTFRGDSSGQETTPGGPAPRWCILTASRVLYFPGYDSPQAPFLQSGPPPSVSQNVYFGAAKSFTPGESVSFVSRVPQSVGAKVNQVITGGTAFLSAPNPTSCLPGATYDTGTPGADMKVEFTMVYWDGQFWQAPTSPTDYITNFAGISFQGHQSGATATFGGLPGDLLCAVTSPADRVVYSPPLYGDRQWYNGALVPPEDQYWIKDFTTAWTLNETVIPV